jgi:hypothetical protein
MYFLLIFHPAILNSQVKSINLRSHLSRLVNICVRLNYFCRLCSFAMPNTHSNKNLALLYAGLKSELVVKLIE